MDFASLFGTFLAVAAIVAGQLGAGGQVVQLFQPVAAVIVLGGTLGGVLIASSWAEVQAAVRSLGQVFFVRTGGPGPLVEEVSKMATLARKEGVLAMEAQRLLLKSEPLKTGLKLVTDGLEARTVREILEASSRREDERDARAAFVFEAAASFSPQWGIVGAVLGLVQVMARLDDPSKMGSGIALAFLCVVYGLAGANLLFEPWAAKLRARSSFRRPGSGWLGGAASSSAPAILVDSRSVIPRLWAA